MPTERERSRHACLMASHLNYAMAKDVEVEALNRNGRSLAVGFVTYHRMDRVEGLVYTVGDRRVPLSSVGKIQRAPR